MALAACLATRLRRIISNRILRARDSLIQKLPTNIEVEAAILSAFQFQEESGIWPKYFPLFNYQKGAAGSNYLFSFEILEVIVHEFENSTLLGNEGVLRGFRRALDWCESNRLIYKHERKTYQGWNSGGQITTLMQGKPEAWATAMVHMFLTKLRKALSKLIERHILRSYGAKSGRVRKDWTAWDNFIDSPVQLPSRKTSIKKLIQREILNDVERGGREFDREKMRHRRSALLFGPPGTSKTSLVRAIAKKIGWPLVELNPSHFLKRGLEHVYSESESIFNDLNDLSWTVVFFDEMDALAQKRGERIDVTRQLLTTSMLPKLSKLHDEGRVLFFMATNHQRNFDPAIKRPGRFDLLICMAPPSWSEKLKNIEKFWIGDRDDDDVEFVKDQLRTWISSH